jgi:acyl transferase domain-containing protein
MDWKMNSQISGIQTERGANSLVSSVASKELLLVCADNPQELSGNVAAFTEELRSKDIRSLAQKSHREFRPSSKMRLAILAADADEFTKTASNSLKIISASPDRCFSMPYKVHYSTGPIKGRVSFVFPGLGSQYLNMGEDIAKNFTAAQDVWKRIDSLDIGKQLRDMLFTASGSSDPGAKNQEELLTPPQWGMPGVSAVAAAHLAMLEKIGLKPDCTAGLSLGELPALFAAGAIRSVEDLMTISRKWGEILIASASENGAMTAVFTKIEELQAMLDKWNVPVVIGNINSPTQAVLSGGLGHIEEVEKRFAETGVTFRRLPVSEAYHSDIVYSSADTFYEYLKLLDIHAPNIPVYSARDAERYKEDVDSICKTVSWQVVEQTSFHNMIQRMYDDGVRLFVELGPGAALTGIIDDCLAGKEHTAVSLDGKGSADKRYSGLDSFWNAIGRVAVEGVDIDLTKVWDGIIGSGSGLEGTPLPQA